ncbi:hypothetical protein HNR02_001829 [Amycolatopsis endophytica]|uniref:PE domain-containing protein n=1 Tax=Amycolatopsis endophytica TaxID=860233 RepID=A0A853B1E2_9PSEU|nr:hypothetical protein [Amycolatopsis endophytica]NYI88506.1 hypothetical protein [Amycolatopsis endophytica]
MGNPTDRLTEVPPPAPIKVGNGGSAGGYEFSPDEVRGVISKWKELLTDLQTDLSNANTIAEVKPPGQEFASGDFVNRAAKVSGETLQLQHQRMVDYVKNYIEALQKAAGIVEENEDEQHKNVGGYQAV